MTCVRGYPHRPCLTWRTTAISKLGMVKLIVLVYASPIIVAIMSYFIFKEKYLREVTRHVRDHHGSYIHGDRGVFDLGSCLFMVYSKGTYMRILLCKF